MTANPLSGRLCLDLTSRTCLVTGAARGIGQAIAAMFAAHGASVVVADRDEAGAREAAAQINTHIADASGRALAVCADAGQRDALVCLVDTAVQRFGGLDVVVHNAAYYPLTPFLEIDEAVLERTLSVNLKAAFWLTQAATPYLKRSGRGRVLVTSSVTGPRVAYPGLAHYAASKAGINGFIRSAALELASAGITVNGVEPGMIRTPAQANLGDDSHSQQLAAAIPLGRLGSPRDIAAAMLFLASDAASYITGQTLIVDGGALLPEAGVRLSP